LWHVLQFIADSSLPATVQHEKVRNGGHKRMNRLLNAPRDIFDTVTSRFRGNALSEISAQGDISNILPIHVEAPANIEEGFSSGGLTFRAFPSGGVPLLDSFFFQYTRCQNFTASCFGQVDHHITHSVLR